MSSPSSHFTLMRVRQLRASERPYPPVSSSLWRINEPPSPDHNAEPNPA
jgi:hypothetical protein